MRKTKVQKEFQKQMASQGPKKTRKTPFTQTRGFHILRTLLLILVFLWLVGLFDSSIATILDYYR